MPRLLKPGQPSIQQPFRKGTCAPAVGAQVRFLNGKMGAGENFFYQDTPN
jgi:hypothetical protein